MNSFSFRFLTREGCHLCDDARPVVHREARRAGVEIVEVDVDSDDDMVKIYGLRIPVILGPGDQVLAEGVIADDRALRRAFRALRSG